MENPAGSHFWICAAELVIKRTDCSSEVDNYCDWRKSNEQLHWTWGRALSDFSQTVVQCPCTDKGYKVFESGFNKISSKPLETVFRSQHIFSGMPRHSSNLSRSFLKNHSFVWHSSSFKVFTSKLFVECPERGERRVNIKKMHKFVLIYYITHSGCNQSIAN